MFVYGSLVVSGMVFPGYDNGFHRNLSFSWMPWYVEMFISIFSFSFPDGFHNPRQRWSQGSFVKTEESID